MENHRPCDGSQNQIRLSPPDMTETEREALLAAFDVNVNAPSRADVESFEARIAERVGAEAALALTSGTAALHVGLRVLGVVRGDTVIVPALSFVSSPNAVRYNGAVPYFVDADGHTANIDAALMADTIGALSRAGRTPATVMTVDMYGTCCDYDPIREVCDDHDIPILENAAEALGASYRGRPAGSLGDLAAFSFGDSSMISSGGGGALVGPAPFIERARHLSTHASDQALHFEHSELGYGYEMAGILAALGNAQLSRLDEMMSRTRTVHSRYVEHLSNIDGLHILDQNGYGRGNGWMTVVFLDERRHPTPHEICALLADEGIEAAPAWKPMHLQPLYRDSEIAGGPVAERHYRRGLCLPSGSNLSESDQDRVIASLRNALDADAVADTLDLSDVRDRRAQNEDSSVTSEQSGDQLSMG